MIMDTILFGIGLLVATGAFFVLIKASKIRKAIQQNIDENVKNDINEQQKTKRNSKHKRELVPA